MVFLNYTYYATQSHVFTLPNHSDFIEPFITTSPASVPITTKLSVGPTADRTTSKPLLRPRLPRSLPWLLSPLPKFLRWAPLSPLRLRRRPRAMAAQLLLPYAEPLLPRTYTKPTCATFVGAFWCSN
ncbi:hypothetical protein H257_13191 [Aphanomyces astaci]|uniref:Uncharacterized protein n=1 Tax=Aphanomyces astaci TaxID=112090 RepID=W4FXZ3_APHAT|nr:hypothetical protein H257_13191 [Aphanomyces astaci]ETV71528.1 hypothetical protein H257_13191 [Aphanomyces astaci]|eukprot:XP_009838961.1 hypothetical protein H257_13191 [Aphanomyces astaci]